MNRCFVCKGNVLEKQTTYMVDLDGHIIIVKNVPSFVCTQCGDTTYSTDVVKQLERIVKQLRKEATELSIVNYANIIAA